MYGYMGRPRRRSSFFGAMFAAAFGVFWTLTAAKSGAPAFFVLFGVIFIVAAIAGGVSHLVNGGAGCRSMSRFDGGYSSPRPGPTVSQPAGYCPSCGATRPRPFRFCPNCGKPSGQM